MFATGIAAVLSCYPLDIVQHVADPRTGLPGRSKWMPNPAEVRDACDARVRQLATQRRFDTWGQNRDEQVALPAPPGKKLTRAEMEARFGKNYGLGNRLPANEALMLGAHLQRMGQSTE